VTKTRTDLIHRTLRNLGVLPQGQSPNAQESQSIDDLIDPTLAELKTRQVTLVDIDANYIEDEFFLPLGRIMAAAAAPEFGQSQDQAIWALKERAEMDIKKMTAARYSGIILEGTYY
jgi:hypothetical protein